MNHTQKGDNRYSGQSTIRLGEVGEDGRAYFITVHGLNGSYELISNLHETDNCGQQYCHCEDSPREFNIAVDGLESFILALAAEGVDIEDPRYAKALQTALDAIAHEYDE